jgi:hypothetical protein
MKFAYKMLFLSFFILIANNAFSSETLSKCNVPAMGSLYIMDSSNPGPSRNDDLFLNTACDGNYAKKTLPFSILPISNKYRSDKKEYRYSLIDRTFHRRLSRVPVIDRHCQYMSNLFLLEYRMINCADFILTTEMRE